MVGLKSALSFGREIKERELHVSGTREKTADEPDAEEAVGPFTYRQKQVSIHSNILLKESMNRFDNSRQRDEKMSLFI
jgi:hypothetical protein